MFIGFDSGIEGADTRIAKNKAAKQRWGAPRRSSPDANSGKTSAMGIVTALSCHVKLTNRSKLNRFLEAFAAVMRNRIRALKLLVFSTASPSTEGRPANCKAASLFLPSIYTVAV
jgi:hypothetical protein